MVLLENRKKLNLGCGRYPDEEAINVDIAYLPGVDFNHDLNKPFPEIEIGIGVFAFGDGRFEEVVAQDIVEHLDDVIAFTREVWRMLKIGGRFKFHTNYAGHLSGFTDPTHKHFFTPNSFDYFDPTTFLGEQFGFYSPDRKFKIHRKEINQSGTGIWFELEKI